MTEEKFTEQAKEYGYTDDEILDLLKFFKESGLPITTDGLMEHIID